MNQQCKQDRRFSLKLLHIEFAQALQDEENSKACARTLKNLPEWDYVSLQYVNVQRDMNNDSTVQDIRTDGCYNEEDWHSIHAHIYITSVRAPCVSLSHHLV